jgi:lipopolysaccharide export system protein LptA
MLTRLASPLRFAVALCVAATALLGVPAQADPLAVVEGEALDVSAERLEVNIEEGTAVLQGKVHATLGELDVRCPKVEIGYDQAPMVRWAKGTGGVQASIRGIRARADVVEVDVAKRQVRLSGAVELTRGRGWIKAERAMIDLATRKVSLSSVTGSVPVEQPAR